MVHVQRIATTLLATLLLSGCIGPPAETQATNAAVERLENVGVPDGYRVHTFTLDTIETDFRGLQSGTLVSNWVPIEEGEGSATLIDGFLTKQGYSRFWDGSCYFNGGYSLDYVRRGLHLRILMSDEAEYVTVAHRYDSTLHAPAQIFIADQQLSELPECPFQNDNGPLIVRPF